jgi:hypothetical protein
MAIDRNSRQYVCFKEIFLIPEGEHFTAEEFSNREAIARFKNLKTSSDDCLWLMQRFPEGIPLLQKVKKGGQIYYYRIAPESRNNDSVYQKYRHDSSVLKSKSRGRRENGTITRYIGDGKKKKVLPTTIQLPPMLIRKIKSAANNKSMTVEEFLSSVV